MQPSKYQLLWIHLKTEFDLDRTKLIAISLLFLFFGMTSVVMQLFLPDILELSGLEITNLPDPSLQSALADYWGDISILAMVIILVSMSTFSSELDINKSGYYYLSRPVSRGTYYLTRYLLRVVGIMLLFVIANTLIYLYALLFFDPLETWEFLLSSLLLALNIGSIAAIVMALSTRFSSAISGGIGFTLMFLQIIVGMVEFLKWTSPFAIASIWQEIIFSADKVEDIGLHLMALILWIVVPCILGLIQYRRRDLV